GDDADGDGKIDAIESATADCDEDGTPDQDDPTDGADPFGVCGTILGDDACLALCTEAAARACVGFEAATCLAECDVFVAESANTEACVAPFDALATCAVAQHGLRCPMSTSRFTSFPDFDEGVCR
ncbi:MAG: hypothetical protein KC635_23665, partial [Myxococcales bacterium]|nr:hypothetical protein [Myxococcales bacterium]